MKNRPKDSTAEEFRKAWDNNTYCMEALWRTIDALIAENTGVKKEDFDCPNHYAKLAYQMGMTKAYETIKALLPAGAKPE